MHNYDFEVLTVQFLNNNIGKEITWHAYGSKGILPSKGICKILGTESAGASSIPEKNILRPRVENIKGDDLCSAWTEDDQFVCSESQQRIYLGSAFDIYKMTVNNAERILMVRNGEVAREVANNISSATDITLEHIV
jgi:hypothetical protein